MDGKGFELRAKKLFCLTVLFFWFLLDWYASGKFSLSRIVGLQAFPVLLKL